MGLTQQKLKKTPEIAQKTLDNALYELKREILGTIDEQIETSIKDAMKGVKLQVKSLYDALEMTQQSQELFQKQVNLKIGAITGHVERKERASKKEEVIEEGLDLEEAITLANIQRKKLGLELYTIPEINQKPNEQQDKTL